jgi:histidinol phosphatase-like enzyme (inositol monophosphatase family)
MTPAETRSFIPFAHMLADAARAAILPHFREAIPIDDKPGAHFDPVTEADRAAERAMRDLIAAHHPAHGVLGEEYGATPSRDGWSWTLDPVDGTRAFISGLPLWGTLIALAYEGRPVIGIIDQGFLDERYIGFPGGAEVTARGVTKPLSARTCAHLNQATIATTDPFLFDGAEAGGFEMVRRTARLARYGCDCYAYAMLADGRVDLVIESGLKPWDVQALIPVIEGAGGMVTNWRGGPAWAGGQVIASGDSRPHEQALVALKRAARA